MDGRYRAFSATNGCFKLLEEPSSKGVGGVGLIGWKPPRLGSWRYSQPRTAKAAASVAVFG